MAFKNVLAAACVLAASTVAAAAFELKSPDIAPGGGAIAETFVYKGFGCAGGDLSPALVWKNPPEGTKSFAVLVHDPDAPTGGAGWWHWLVVDIPAATNSLPQGAGGADGAGLPAGARQVTTDFGAAGWGGPCPPTGDKPHHYNFTVYALKVDKLELPQNPTASLVGFMVNANAIAKARFTGLYGR